MLNIELNGAVVEFQGELNCHTVVAYWPFKLLAKLPKQTVFNLAALQHVDTAGLAWLIKQLALAKQQGITVTLSQMPAQLRSLATVSDVVGLLPTD